MRPPGSTKIFNVALRGKSLPTPGLVPLSLDLLVWHPVEHDGPSVDDQGN